MKRHIVWELVDGVSTEHLTVEFDPVRADGVVVGVAEGEEAKEPFRVRYRVQCDESGMVQQVEIETLSENFGIELEHDAEGNWTKNGEPAPELTGYRDVDIAVTPFTNTIPIRRLDWESGESETISVVYLDVPAMTAKAVEQQYTCLEPVDSDGGLFRYESLESGFTAELPVDSDGVVEDYPSVFRRAEL
ncbi:putative glycolipid-binding domain-containing protein [Haladaptatus cibarius]|uniref:putative glycolipid-binding domain-containing protein n=1 Tax=Haladaptatus cibarius TaxID=453847 RepID=UPI000678F5F6|nr:putative glycolipid-binding domain-containing protein [Haladaptatus cibarius]